MISLEQYKKALGSKVEMMTDEQINNRMELQARFAKAVFNMWSSNLKKTMASKNELKLVE
jgi:radical SAM superfamily enzyme